MTVPHHVVNRMMNRLMRRMEARGLKAPLGFTDAYVYGNSANGYCYYSRKTASTKAHTLRLARYWALHFAAGCRLNGDYMLARNWVAQAEGFRHV